MPEKKSSFLAILELIQKGIELGGDIAPIAIRAFAELRADHADEEFTALARQKNDLDEQKIRALIAKASE